MKISGSYTLHAPRERVWPLIHDPGSLAAIIPGCDHLDASGDGEYTGRMQIPVPTVAGVYTTRVRLLDDETAYSTRFRGEMNGPAGSLSGTASFRLDEIAGGSLLAYEGQGIITGPLGRMNPRFAEGVAQTLINQGLAVLDKRLQEEAEAARASEALRRPALPLWLRLAVAAVARRAEDVRALFRRLLGG